VPIRTGVETPPARLQAGGSGHQSGMKLLAMTSEPITANDLRAALGAERAEDVEVMVVAPALHTSALRFWVSDADEAIATALRVEAQSVSALAHAGIKSSTIRAAITSTPS
jgi:hypothetical protein